MTPNQFKDAAHRRGVSVGVVALTDPARPNGIRATLYTEFALAFPGKTGLDPFAMVLITRFGTTLPAIEQTIAFSLNIMRVDQLQFAKNVYAGAIDRSAFSTKTITSSVRSVAGVVGNSGAVPYILDADASYFCALRNHRSIGSAGQNDYRLVQAEVVDVEVRASVQPDPLLNHLQDYWRLQRPSLSAAYDANVPNNDRFTRQS